MIQPVGQPDLFIIGLGVIIPEHVTRQASQALSKCRRIYSIVQEPPHLWLPADSFAQTEVVNALGFYREGELRANNYKRAALAITEAIGGGRPLGYVTYGNPTSYDRVAQELVEHGKKRGFTVEIVPGISSVDTILCDLMIDMAPGIQVFEASWLFTCQISPIPTIPVLLPSRNIRLPLHSLLAETGWS